MSEFLVWREDQPERPYQPERFLRFATVEEKMASHPKCEACRFLVVALHPDGEPLTDNRGNKFKECVNMDSNRFKDIIWEPDKDYCPHWELE